MDAPPLRPHSYLTKSRDGRGAIQRPLVVVVDDDESVRESVPDLLRVFGFAVRAFSSSEEFLVSDSYGQAKCLVLDMAMPGITGLELQQELKLRGRKIPIIFMTGQRDESVRRRHSRGGRRGSAQTIQRHDSP
jgi:FixJ family two-component response regulator